MDLGRGREPGRKRKGTATMRGLPPNCHGRKRVLSGLVEQTCSQYSKRAGVEAEAGDAPIFRRGIPARDLDPGRVVSSSGRSKRDLGRFTMRARNSRWRDSRSDQDHLVNVRPEFREYVWEVEHLVLGRNHNADGRFSLYLRSRSASRSLRVICTASVWMMPTLVAQLDNTLS